MLRELYNKGKEYAEKVTNYVMNYTEVEARVVKATNTDQWGPDPSLMEEIAQDTRNHDTCREVSQMLMRCMFPDEPHWLCTYKSLVLMDYLVKNGSQNYVHEAEQSVYSLRSLESYRFFDERGRDKGENVRAKVVNVIKLLECRDTIMEERNNALALKKKLRSFGSDSYNVSSAGSRQNYSRDEDIQLDSARSNQSISSRDVASSRSNNRPVTGQNRLSSFEDWQGAPEQNIGTEVMDTVKDVWHSTKLGAKIFFGQAPQTTSADSDNEASSDYYYQQKNNEAGGCGNDDYWQQNYVSYPTNPTRRETNNNVQKEQRAKKQPPAVVKNNVPVADLLSFDDDFVAPQVQPAKPIVTMTNGNLFDLNDEFSDFQGATQQSAPSPLPTSQTAQSQAPNLDLFNSQPAQKTQAAEADLFDCFVSSTVKTNNNNVDLLADFGSFNGNSVLQPMSKMSLADNAVKTEAVASPSSSAQMGKTWSNLGVNLNIDPDALVNRPKASVQLSLAQLKQQQQQQKDSFDLN